MKSSLVMGLPRLFLVIMLLTPAIICTDPETAESTVVPLDATSEIALFDENTEENQKIDEIISLLIAFIQSIAHLSEHPEKMTEQTQTALMEMIAAIIGASLDTSLAHELAIDTDQEAELTKITHVYGISRRTKSVEPKEQTLPARIDEETRELIRHTFAAIFSNAAGILTNPRNAQNVSTCISNMVGSIITAIMTSARHEGQTPAVKRSMARMAYNLAHDENLLAEIEGMVAVTA